MYHFLMLQLLLNTLKRTIFIAFLLDNNYYNFNHLIKSENAC